MMVRNSFQQLSLVLAFCLFILGMSVEMSAHEYPSGILGNSPTADCDYDGLSGPSAGAMDTIVMACKNVNVSLNEECYVIIHPAMVLAGFYTSYENFIVEVSYHGKIISDSVTTEHIGHTLTVKVVDTILGNSCWSDVLIEDKFPPRVFCSNDTVHCMDYKMYYDTPRVVDFCQSYELKKIDEQVTSFSCDTDFLKRVDQEFVAYDESGNVSETCARSIYIKRFPLEDVVCPPQNKEIYCDDEFLKDGRGLGHPDPSVTGSPILYSEKHSTLYGADNQGNLFTVDLVDGSASLITDKFNNPPLQECFSIGRNMGVTEIEFDPIEKRLYGKAVDGCDYGFEFDPITGCVTEGPLQTVARPQTGFGDFQGAEVIDGIWYVSSVTTTSLEIFDPIMGTFTPVGPHGGGVSFSGLAYDGTTLYGCASRGGTGLYSIDIGSGMATFIGDMGVVLGSLEFGPDGILYGGGAQGSSGRIYRINPANAATSLVGFTGLGTTITGLALVNDPIPLYPQPDFFCNLWVDYEDIDLGEIGCTRKIMRTWKVQEWWCTEDFTQPCIQFIYIIDTVGPDIKLYVDSIYAKTKTGFHTCNGDVYLPEPEVDDDCHAILRTDIRYPGGFIKDWQGEHITLETGFHTVYYIAYDSCYNSTTDSVIVHVVDKISPIAVCDQNTTISLDNDGIVHAYADVFDDGSFDECVIKKMEVRRMDDPCGSGTDEWGDYVEFCCADVNQEVMVGFRVIDKSGNSGSCMVSVLVNDKIPPTIVCPPNITVDCRFDFDPNDLNVFGRIVSHDSLRQPIVIDSDTVRFNGPALDGYAYDNCPMIIKDSFDITRIDNCGQGFLYRYFRATDAQGQSTPLCFQSIYFTNATPFTEDDIIWPENIDTLNVCFVGAFDPDLLPERYGYPRFILEDECELVGASYKDHVIDNTGGAAGCFKILRQWKVIDWCQRRGNEFVRWEHEQQIIVQNDRAPFIRTDCADTVKCFYINDCKNLPITLTEEAIDDCTPADELFWIYKIDLDNDGSFDSIVSGTNILTGAFHAGTHRVKWFVEDRCGNEATCEYLFELRNCLPPVAYCRTGVILDLVPWDTDNDGTPDVEKVELWASDLDDGSFHDCGYGVTFSFSADTADKSRVYDCDSIGTHMVTIYVTDRTNGNVSKCITSVIIQDNNNVDICPQTANGIVFGRVVTEDDESVLGVSIKLEGANTPDQMTDVNGQYAFSDMPYGGNYAVVPSKTNGHDNGVTTADIVEIRRYLLGYMDFNSPYKHIAADINMSGAISAADISDLRKLVLGLDSELEHGQSWRFIDKTYVFEDPNDPLKEPFTEIIDLPGFDSNQQQAWVGIKLGDLNNSVDPSNAGGIIKTRSVENLAVRKKDLRIGESEIVRLRANELTPFNGIQFTLWVDPSLAVIEDILPLRDDVNFSHFNLTLKFQGLVSFSWNTSSADAISLDELFAIKIRPLRDVRVEEVVKVTSDITSALLSNEYGESGIGLVFRELRVKSEEVVLYQNEPNPWADQTRIGFYLPEAQDIELVVLDGTGRVVLSQKGYFERGDQNVILDKKDLNDYGVLYYQLRARDHVSVRKMIVMN